MRRVERGRVGELSPLRSGVSWATDRWHQDGANLLSAGMHDWTDVETFFRSSILPGHAPQAPILKADEPVITIGSCFAEELRRALETGGFASSNFFVPNGLNNTFAVCDFMSWCATGEATEAGWSYERHQDGTISEWTPSDERERYRTYLEHAGAFVFTLGLAEVWEDIPTGKIFWRGVPDSIFDAGRHRFRLSTVDENVRNIRDIVAMVRTVNERAPIVITLSPVPLRATFRDISCVTADCVSKSVLRVAIDQAMSDATEGVFYWPSFELVKWVGAVVPWSAYGSPDARHVNTYLIQTAVKSFIRAFYGVEAESQFTTRSRPLRQPRKLTTDRQRTLTRARWKGEMILTRYRARRAS